MTKTNAVFQTISFLEINLQFCYKKKKMGTATEVFSGLFHEDK